MIDEALDILTAKSGQSRNWNVKQVELIGNSQSNVPHEGVADLIDLDIEHDLGTRVIEVFYELGGRIQDILRCANGKFIAACVLAN